MEHLVIEVGRGLAADVPVLGAVASVRSVRALLDGGRVPPWADKTVTAGRVGAWLDAVSACLGERDSLIAAVAGGVLRRYDSASQTQVPFGESDLVELAKRCQDLAGEGENIVSGLGLEMMGGGRQYGFAHIAYMLHSAATDADFPEDARPALPGTSPTETRPGH